MIGKKKGATPAGCQEVQVTPTWRHLSYSELPSTGINLAHTDHGIYL